MPGARAGLDPARFLACPVFLIGTKSVKAVGRLDILRTAMGRADDQNGGGTRHCPLRGPGLVHKSAQPSTRTRRSASRPLYGRPIVSQVRSHGYPRTTG
jgi:hypothetical protein